MFLSGRLISEEWIWGAKTHLEDDGFEKCSICTILSSVNPHSTEPFYVMTRIFYCHSFLLMPHCLSPLTLPPNVKITASHSYHPQTAGCQGAPAGLPCSTNYLPNPEQEMIFIFYASVSWHFGLTQGRYIGDARATVSGYQQRFLLAPINNRIL